MPIMVGKNYKLENDKYNIILMCKAEVDEAKSQRMKETLQKRWGKIQVESDDDEDKAEKGWKVAGYFSSIPNAFDKIVRLEISKSELKDVQTVVDAINNATRQILVACSKLPQTLSEAKELIENEV